MTPRRDISLTVNGRRYQRAVDPRISLADLLRDDVGLTGTHLGCEQGACGACTVLLDGATARSCITLAVQADGASVTTVEGLASDPTNLHPVQRAFTEHHGLQCGFCTPGFLLAAVELLAARSNVPEPEVRKAIAGNLCR
ncbi:MAG: 2Fe-2S iron-sulfur cluster binding domain-containing protein, partial [Pseudonocardiaceae bacterium]|nr:2Fe-2S iron-sulfur cluster binding domain-containing protein [Pseudonocardiaceae bacterium]